MKNHPFHSLFDDVSQWQVFASGQAEGRLSQTSSGLRLDYDFHGGGGFVAIRRVLAFKLPDTFEIGFDMHGDGPPNHFEFKVAGPGGANVWRHLKQDFKLPEKRSAHHFNERSLPFAWGPAGGGAPSDVEAVEFVIAAGPGGKGVLEISSPTFADETPGTPVEIRASSQQPGFQAEAIFDNQSLTSWRAESADASPALCMDFGRQVRFGGLVIQWPEDLPARDFLLELSDDGGKWRSVHQAVRASGTRSFIAVPHGEARHLRLSFANAECAAIVALALRPDAFSHTPNEFIHAVAASFPRGWFPRYWLREQSYWTPVGSREGKRRALVNEEGMVEVDEAGFSLEPFLWIDGKPVTWADVKSSCALPKGGAPLPTVAWKTRAVRLEILPWVDGTGDDLTLHITYRLKRTRPSADARLAIAARPFQVNSPWQAFRNLGGRSPIRHISCEADGMIVQDRRVIAMPAPDSCGAATFDEGGVSAFLTNGVIPSHREADDSVELATGVLVWDLPADEKTFEVTVSVAFFTKPRKPDVKARTKALATWRGTLGKVKWSVPASATPAFDCFRTAAAHILINRDGPAIQPGPRRYTRSWVRDCVIMGAALAKAGLPTALKEFLSWYAQFQRADGFIPCVVDRDGVDWLVEHDSHGQFLWGVREVMRGGGNRKFLRAMWPHVRKAADYLIALRGERMTPNYQNTTCHGLLPESASHEGYLAHPVHSYWDDFWGVRGLQAAADLADDAADALRWRNEAARFQTDVLTSMEKLIAEKKLSYIPGSVEWADFDPTATSNAIAMLDFADALPSAPLRAMLATYIRDFRRKHGGDMPWTNYTAYEIRIIGAFVRLRQRDIANELLTFFLSDRRPLPWNQWPEITWRDPRSPGHLGDVPHTWIAAEYLLAVSSMVASERESTDSIVLAPGIPWSWISSKGGFTVKGLPTRHGKLDFRIAARGDDAIEIEVGGKLTMPPGGLTLDPPLPPGRFIEAGDLTIHSLPHHGKIRYSRP